MQQSKKLKSHPKSIASSIINQSIMATGNASYLLAAVSSNLSTSTNSNTTTKLTSKQNPKAKTDTTELEIINIDCTASAYIITANGATKTPIGKINDLLIEVNGIIVSIKVLVMEATQYQALVGNDWLSKTNTTFDWTTQELQISQNGQHT
ncbi:hypothetical protein G9A89_010348 [Geosiphon pyriformis]|nr:hypothetical protein G9A89_010348 [Geosiphon pyriformis]